MFVTKAISYSGKARTLPSDTTTVLLMTLLIMKILITLKTGNDIIMTLPITHFSYNVISKVIISIVFVSIAIVSTQLLALLPNIRLGQHWLTLTNTQAYYTTFLLNHCGTQHNDIQQNDIQHNDTQHKGLKCHAEHSDTQNKGLSIKTFCHYAECRYAECHVLFIIMLNVIVLSVITLSVTFYLLLC